jgi:phosphoribosylanthranilate isomerase
MTVWVKICGITNVDDALAAVQAGADAIGVNLIAASKRRVTFEVARSLYEAVAGRAEVVAVVADSPLEELLRVRRETGIDWLQLHGHEPNTALLSLLPYAYKAVPIATSEDVAHASSFAGERILTDAKVEGALGGTGQRFDWDLVRALAGKRKLILAGGLEPTNVREAVRTLGPFGVDVASGVESGDPRRKDSDKVFTFVAEARAASERQ